MAIFSTLGSHRRMLSTVTWSACSAAAGRRSAAAYSVVATWSSANALRVASRLRWMYGSPRPRAHLPTRLRRYAHKTPRADVVEEADAVIFQREGFPMSRYSM